jgi:hypothetical protein
MGKCLIHKQRGIAKIKQKMYFVLLCLMKYEQQADWDAEAVWATRGKRNILPPANRVNDTNPQEDTPVYFMI